MSSLLAVDALSKVYGSARGETRAIEEISFTVTEGSFTSVVGPSGCGKTTLLRCVAGLLAPSGGRVMLRGELVTEPPLGMALVFQDYSRSLFPWLTVEKNVRLPLRGRATATEPVVNESIEAVGLSRFRDHHPWQLSGGMQQRVAIARALAYQPQVLLMDEPFASVDAQTRAELEDLVLRVRTEFGVTVLLVTHDIDEAVYMSDHVIVLRGSPSSVREVVEVDLPRPRNQVLTKEMPDFVALRGHVYRGILGRDPAANTQATTVAEPAPR